MCTYVELLIAGAFLAAASPTALQDLFLVVVAVVIFIVIIVVVVSGGRGGHGDGLRAGVRAGGGRGVFRARRARIEVHARFFGRGRGNRRLVIAAAAVTVAAAVRSGGGRKLGGLPDLWPA